MTELEKEYIALTCVAAACADGHLGAAERQRIQDLLTEMGWGDRDPFRTALSRPVDPAAVAGAVRDPAARRMAYQMAVVVCQSDGVLTEGETAFLARLQEAFGLSDAAATGMRLEASHYVDPGLPPAPTGPAPTGDSAQSILRYAILAGAAELLPQTAATMVVLPLQMKLVYEVGRRHGVTLDASQVGELVAAFGMGAAAQMVEGFARRLLGSVARGVGGKVLGGLMGGAAGTAAGALMSFSTTYALGHTAETYYARGRRLSEKDLRELFEKFREDARTIYPRVEAEIRDQAARLDAEELLGKVRGAL